MSYNKNNDSSNDEWNDEDEDEDLINTPSNDMKDLNNPQDFRVLKDYEHYVIMRDEHIMDLIQVAIHQVRDYLGLDSDDIAQQLLAYYTWDLDKLLAEIEQLDKTLVKAGVRLGDESIRGQSQEECPLCLDDFIDLPSANPIMLALQCNHKICTNCMLDYLKSRLKVSPLELLNSRCPAHPKCNLTIPRSRYLELLKYYPGNDEITNEPLKDQLTTLYFKWLKHHYVQSLKDCKYCPADCGLVCKVKDKDCPWPRVRCECKYEWCFKCSKEDHSPLTCEENQKWTAKVEKDNEDMVYIFKNTKKCPNKNCEERIEKNSGCVRMTCAKCRFEFCWSCMQKWHGYDNIKACVYYDKNKDHNSNLFTHENFLTEYQKEYYTQDTEKYMFCINKFAENRNAIQFIEKTTIQKFNDVIREFQSKHHTIYLESDYIYDALDIVKRLRQSMKFAYAYYYYQSENLELFNNYLMQITKNVEMLAEHTDNFVKNLAKYIEEKENYDCYKCDVIRLTANCKTILKNYRQYIDYKSE